MNTLRTRLAAIALGVAGLVGLGVVALAAMSPQERAAMGRNGKAFSVSEFDRSTLITRLEGWLDEIEADLQ